MRKIYEILRFGRYYEAESSTPFSFFFFCSFPLRLIRVLHIFLFLCTYDCLLTEVHH